MPIVIGTAGHVDHGKTTLIHALTGIKTQHLPEEKKRGMTIDLGFASFEDPMLGTIGVVDVPGHERFVRNMVAGAWGLNAVLLVVAADDGWMQMSSEHLRIFKALHIHNIILVINKCDLVEEDYTALILEDIQEKCHAILGTDLVSCCVSAETGEGITTLKNIIQKALLPLSQDHDTVIPKIYIDRVFTLKGIGTTITGTLGSGKIHKEQELILAPGNHHCKIKTIHNHHKEVETLQATSRVALNLKTVEKTSIKRGMMLTHSNNNELLEGTELIIYVDQYFTNQDKELRIKNHKEIEIALGSMHAKGFIHFAQKSKHIARITLDRSVACTWNQRGVLIQQGGYAILGACRILSASNIFHRISYKHITQIYSEREITSFVEFILLMNGYIEYDSIRSTHSDIDIKELAHLHKWVMLTSLLNTYKKNIILHAKKNTVGFTIEELNISLPKDLLLAIVAQLVEEKKLSQEDNRYFIPELEHSISKEGQSILDLALRAGRQGIESNKLNISGAKKEIRNLITMKKLVLLEGALCYHVDIYHAICKQILQGKKKGDVITIALVRNTTALSRKYIIPILNIMEQEGLLSRDGNDRIIL